MSSPAPNQPREPITVAILAFAETSASVVFGIYDLLASAGRDWPLLIDGVPGQSRLRPVIASRHTGPFEAANGVTIIPQRGLDNANPPRIIFVSEVNLPPGAELAQRFRAEIDWLKNCFEAGSTIATACSGAMLLAQAGLLDGHEATTHWAWCDVLKKQHPKVQVREQRALVITGQGQRLVMAGGGTSWLDLSLYLIGRFVGVDEAMQVAKLNLIDWHAIGQQPFAHVARATQVGDATIARCQVWIADHYREPAPVAAMVRLSGLAERTFKRRFREATGLAPLEYVHTLRIEEAKHLLETGELPIEAVAELVGYEDAGFFSRLFKKRVNLPPAQYRKRFGALRRELSRA